jgi:hypothetical protein
VVASPFALGSASGYFRSTLGSVASRISANRPTCSSALSCACRRWVELARPAEGFHDTLLLRSLPTAHVRASRRPIYSTNDTNFVAVRMRIMAHAEI